MEVDESRFLGEKVIGTSTSTEQWRTALDARHFRSQFSVRENENHSQGDVVQEVAVSRIFS